MKMAAAALKGLEVRQKRYDVGLEERGLWARVYPSGRIAIQYLYLKTNSLFGGESEVNATNPWFGSSVFQ